jgi:glycosyltransferase involved in cell wall biosynthesis
MTKTIFIITTESWTIEFYLKRLLLDMSDYNIYVFGSGEAPSFIQYKSNISYIDIKSSRNINFNELLSFFYLIKYTRIYKPDIFLTILPKANYIGQIVGALTCVPKRILVLTGQLWLNAIGLRYLGHYFGEKLLCYLATDVFTDSKSQLELVLKEHSFILKKRHAYNNGISIGANIPFPIKAESKYNSEKFYIGHIGRLCKRKGSDVFINISENLLCLDNEIQINIIGPCEDDNIYEMGTVLQKKWPKRVNFETRFFESTSELRKLNLLVMPSIFEGFGIMAVEACRMGVPVIAADVVGLRDSVIDGATGFHVSSSDEVKMHVANLLSDRTLYKELVLKTLEFARTNYEASTYFQKLRISLLDD